MRTPTVASALLAFLMTSAPAAGLTQEQADRWLVVSTCSGCHAVDPYYMANRSRKAWELTVRRMQDHVYDDATFTDAEANRIVRYLVAHPFEEGHYKPSAPGPAGTAGPTTAPATAPAVAATRPMAAARRPAPRSPAKATVLAKVMGYVAAAALAVMVVTGLARRKIGRLFRKTHGVLAFVFCGALTVHASVFLAEYGAPAVFWLWCGIIATVILLASEFTGLLKLRNRTLFVKVHVTAGLAGLVLTAIHWVWIYI